MFWLFCAVLVGWRLDSVECTGLVSTTSAVGMVSSASLTFAVVVGSRVSPVVSARESICSAALAFVYCKAVGAGSIVGSVTVVMSPVGLRGMSVSTALSVSGIRVVWCGPCAVHAVPLSSTASVARGTSRACAIPGTGEVSRTAGSAASLDASGHPAGCSAGGFKPRFVTSFKKIRSGMVVGRAGVVSSGASSATPGCVGLGVTATGFSSASVG